MSNPPPQGPGPEIRALRLGRTKEPASGNIAPFAFGCSWTMPLLSTRLSSGRSPTVTLGELRAAGGFWKAYKTDLESIQCTWSKQKVLIGMSAQKSQLGSVYLWDPVAGRVRCLGKTIVPQAILYAASIDAFLIYGREDGWGSFRADLGIVSSTVRGAWKLEVVNVETYDLSQGAPQARSPTASAHLLRSSLRNAVALSCASDLFPDGALGWDESKQCCAFKVCESVYSFPLTKTRSGVVCADRPT